MNFQQGYRPPQRPRKKLSMLGSAVLVLAAVAAIAAVSVFGVRFFQEKNRQDALAAELAPYQNVFLPNIFVDGVNLGGMTAQEGIDAVVSRIQQRENGWNLQLTYQNHVFYTLHYDDLSISTDIASVYSLLEPLYQKGKTGTLDERKAELEALKAQAIYAYTTQSDMNDERLDTILSQIQEQLTYDPTDAYLAYFYPDLNDPFIIQPEANGSALDVVPLKEEILAKAASAQSGSLEIHPTSISPSVTTADVRRQLTLLYKATTPVSSTSTADRTDNIRTAFSRLNGTTVAPGDKLSFNKVTLDRTLKNGYKYAIEYELGMETIGVGGGVCQASTTLYLAALQSNLEIVSRISHSDPVSYTTFGQDATVVYNKHDLVIRNTSGGTIYITARVREVKKNKYECEVCIYGPAMEEGVSYSLRTETVEILPAPLTDTYQKDTNHTYVTYKDEEPYLVRKARDGYINETYLQKWKNGELISEKFVSRDTCKARGNVYATGTLDRP